MPSWARMQACKPSHALSQTHTRTHANTHAFLFIPTPTSTRPVKILEVLFTNVYKASFTKSPSFTM